MTPRSAILTLPATVSAREAAALFADSGRSRVPLFGEHRDDIVGILYAKDLFPTLVDAPDPTAISPRKLARPPMFVPESKNAAEMLQEFRDSRVQIAVVLDEYGGVVGPGHAGRPARGARRRDRRRARHPHARPTRSAPWAARATRSTPRSPLEDLNERLGLHLPTDGDFETVGGLAFDALGRLPEPGATFRRDGIEFTVLEVADHSIRKVRIDLQPAEAVS